MLICILVIFFLILVVAAMPVLLSRRSLVHDERPPTGYRGTLFVDVEKGILPFRFICFAGADRDVASLWVQRLRNEVLKLLP